MSTSTFSTFTDPDSFHTAIRAPQVDRVVTGRGHFRAEPIRVDFERLFMRRATETLPRALHMQHTPQRIAVIFATDSGDPRAYFGGLPLRSFYETACRRAAAAPSRARWAGPEGSFRPMLARWLEAPTGSEG